MLRNHNLEDREQWSHYVEGRILWLGQVVFLTKEIDTDNS